MRTVRFRYDIFAVKASIFAGDQASIQLGNKSVYLFFIYSSLEHQQRALSHIELLDTQLSLAETSLKFVAIR